MNKLGMFLLVASMATAGAISSALAQYGDQGGMMGKSGQGHGMMRQGMMRQGAMDGEGKAEGQGMMGCPMMGGKGRGMMNSRPMMEARLAYIKTDLEITETQTEAWDAYADAVRAGSSCHERRACRHDESNEGGNCLGAHRRAYQGGGDQARQSEGTQARNRRSLR